MSPASSRTPCSARRPARLLVLLVAAALLGTTPSATAAPQTFTGTDPAGDSAGPSGLDVVKVTASYDPSSGAATMSIDTAASSASLPSVLSMFFVKGGGSSCAVDAAAPPTLSLAVISSPVDQAVWAIVGTDTQGTLTQSRTGPRLTVSTGPSDDLEGLSFDCVRVETTTLIEDGDVINPVDADVALAFASSAGGSGPGPTTTPAPVVTDQPDADRDGRPDTTDSCPQVPGAATSGCPAMPDALAFRLGDKRVVVDRLVPRTAAACPATVRAVVTSKGRRIGSGSIAVSTFGSYCRLQGVIRLRRIVPKARLVATGAGIARIGKSIRR